jgi:hypothetical protein
MNVKKEVIEKCKSILSKELRVAQEKLRVNRYEINKLAREQRILKSQVGVLYGMNRDLTAKQ